MSESNQHHAIFLQIIHTNHSAADQFLILAPQELELKGASRLGRLGDSASPARGRPPGVPRRRLQPRFAG